MVLLFRSRPSPEQPQQPQLAPSFTEVKINVASLIKMHLSFASHSPPRLALALLYADLSVTILEVVFGRYLP